MVGLILLIIIDLRLPHLFQCGIMPSLIKGFNLFLDDFNEDIFLNTPLFPQETAK
jgi:hypothetical protein